jgi:hypothetical protein
MEAGFDASAEAEVVAGLPNSDGCLEPKILLVAPVLAPRPALVDGGGPAGVVDGLPNLNVGAGVVEPAALEAGVFAGVPKLLNSDLGALSSVLVPKRPPPDEPPVALLNKPPPVLFSPPPNPDFCVLPPNRLLLLPLLLFAPAVPNRPPEGALEEALLLF